MKRLLLSLSCLSLALSGIIFCAYSFAAESATVATAKVANPANVVPGNLLQIIGSLVVVIGVLIGLGMAFKKLGLNRMGSTLPIKIIGATHIGNNQRIMVIEAGEEWVVLGVTPHHISTITSMPRQESEDSVVSNGALSNSDRSNLAVWLQSAVKKYQTKNR